MRLSKNIKEAILKAALAKAGIPAKEQAIKSRYAAWAEAVRVLYVTPEQEALIAKAEIASKAVNHQIKYNSFSANTENGIKYANVAGQRRDVFFNGDLEYTQGATRSIERVAPRSGMVTLTADNPLVSQLSDIDHDRKALKSEIEQLTVSLKAVLDSVTTDKQLIKVWPEAVAFIPAAERAATTNLPALPIAELNKMIGLP